MAYDVLSVCLAPTLQRTLVFEGLALGQVNRALESHLDASGKGVNACRAILRAGGSCHHLTHSGEPGGEVFLSLCEADRIPVEAIGAGACAVRSCTTIVDRESGRATELVEECPSVPPGTWEALLSRFEALLPSSGAVLLSGKAAAGYPPGAMAVLALRAAEAGKPLVLDIRGWDLMSSIEALESRDEGKGRALIVAKPNAAEFAGTWDCQASSIARTAADFSARSGIAFLVTDGENPAIIAESGRSETLPVRSVKSLNATGSGDSCAGGLSLGLAKGASLHEAARLGLELGTRNAETLRPARF